MTENEMVDAVQALVAGQIAMNNANLELKDDLADNAVLMETYDKVILEKNQLIVKLTKDLTESRAENDVLKATGTFKQDGNAKQSLDRIMKNLLNRVEVVDERTEQEAETPVDLDEEPTKGFSDCDCHICRFGVPAYAGSSNV